MLRISACMLVILLCCPAAAQEKADVKEFRGQDAQRVAAWLKVSQDHAADYRFVFRDKPNSPLKLLPKAVFRHSQPVRGDDIGAVYLWVDEAGLPGAIGTVFAYSYGGPGERWVAHEFHSLADAPLAGKWRDTDGWSPDQPGVEWKKVREAPTPAESASGRLRQMRDIARRLAAESTDQNDKRWEMRLITQPIYQYTGNNSDGRFGGAVFLFCQGTDPEVVCLFEARGDSADMAWHYALAPFTDYGLGVKLDGLEVWSLPKNHRPTRTSAHWWNGKMEVKKLSDDEESDLAKAFGAETKGTLKE